jgi:putative membrane protein
MWFLVRVIVNTLAIVVAAYVVPGISVESPLSALGAGLVLGVINALIKPVLAFFTFPLTLATLGLFVFVLNGFCLWLVTLVVGGFHIASVWAAILGAFLISVVSWVLLSLARRA